MAVDGIVTLRTWASMAIKDIKRFSLSQHQKCGQIRRRQVFNNLSDRDPIVTPFNIDEPGQRWI